ncbi:MAG: type I methionyl aminopeptidase [Ignavibacteriales bacterium]|nr:type I methionyl aminopeptidase [Ignavibacteriales bacterium]
MAILIKSEQEIGLMRESCQIVADVIKLVSTQIKPGVTTQELDALAEDYIKSCGGVPAFKGYGFEEGNPFPGTLCVSVDSEVVHGIPGKRVLREGEIVSIDVGVKKNGFYGDGAFTFAVGGVSDEKKRLMKVTKESLDKAVEQAVAGNRIGDIAHAVQSHVEGAGYAVVRDLVGHAVGRELHEDPQVPNYGKPNKGTVLKEGMTLAIEPMVNMGTYEVRTAADRWTIITKDGMPSAHFEYTVVVRKDKAEILTVYN